uniref:Uncharacterized protein n=1 Tax=Micrurus spixii TaxID=129469 RepID=A0A2D4LWJ1_9SAUR
MQCFPNLGYISTKLGGAACTNSSPMTTGGGAFKVRYRCATCAKVYWRISLRFPPIERSLLKRRIVWCRRMVPQETQQPPKPMDLGMRVRPRYTPRANATPYRPE